ncbi:MAG: hypothetical protein F6K54_01560 [Okeania sp. SIO3B5]|uniref:hypothetical protein n=1 Tax=Okeania sp. SIO3B5 TaxID=2607811 RepID=UPI00140197D2|nr:hypothetical protein [Okeania sp. SIO3B5]NEO51889.1 hypothetical protein [Okeania sp. SIO3B5]
MATIRQGDWVKITAHKHPLKNEVLEVLEVDSGRFSVYHEATGSVDLKFHEAELTLKPKDVPTPPTIPNSIVAKIKSLIERYKSINGTIDRRFVEQILGEEIVEQIFKSTGIEGTGIKCSTDYSPKESDRLNPSPSPESSVEQILKSTDTEGADIKCSTNSRLEESDRLNRLPSPENSVEQIFKSTDTEGTDIKCSTNSRLEESDRLNRLPSPENSVEQIFKNTGTGGIDIKCSTRYQGKSKGRPRGSTNKKPASGWIDTRFNSQMATTNYYYCRRQKVKKTPIPTGRVQKVRELIKSEAPVSQIENYLLSSQHSQQVEEVEEVEF